jgi:hypothetical protein
MLPNIYILESFTTWIIKRWEGLEDMDMNTWNHIKRWVELNMVNHIGQKEVW